MSEQFKLKQFLAKLYLAEKSWLGIISKVIINPRNQKLGIFTF